MTSMPATPEGIQLELKLHVARGAPLVATKGYADPEVEESFVRMRELCEQLGTPPQLFPVLFRLRSFYMVRGELHKARELGDQLLRLAEGTQDPELLLEAHYALGATLFYIGEFDPAQQHLAQAAALYDAEAHRFHAFVYGQDPKVAALSHESWAFQRLGFPDQAFMKSEAAITLARQAAHPFSLGLALCMAATLHQMYRDAEAAREHAEAAISLSSEQGFPFWLAYGTIVRGWALTTLGEAETGIAQLRRGLAGYTATGAGLGRSYFLCMLAEACGAAGLTEEALGAVTEALDAAKRTGERLEEARLYRLKGDLNLKRSGEDGPTAKAQQAAEKCYLKAIEVARSQNAKQLDLQAVVSLSRLRQQQSRRPEARVMLSEIYTWFTEGFDTKDLQEAKALLEELG
jgi:predicted ATPase